MMSSKLEQQMLQGEGLRVEFSLIINYGALFGLVICARV